MHVGENGHVHFIFHFLQNAQTLCQTRAAITANRGSIGLVVGSLEDERKIQRAGDALDHFRHEQSMLFALDNARAGNQEQISGSDSDIVDLKGNGHVRTTEDTEDTEKINLRLTLSSVSSASSVVNYLFPTFSGR